VLSKEAQVPELWGRALDRIELLRRIGRLEQAGGVRLVELQDGLGRGTRVLEFRTGAGFAFDVIVDRAFDVGRCEVRGLPLAWVSPVGTTAPWLYDPTGMGWLRTFGGGLVVTAGLDHVQMPGEDSALTYNQPDAKPTESYGLHGRLGGLPARLLGYGERWVDDTCVLWAEGEVLQAAVFGEHLLLHRRIETHMGASWLRIHDRVQNVGHNRTPHMYLYHCNVGYPVVDDGAQIVVPARSTWSTYRAAIDDYRRLTAPVPGIAESCYEHEMVADEDGWVECGVVNDALGLGVYQRYRIDQLPRHQAWRMLGEDTYAVALEPTTNRDAGRWDARQRGELIELDAGETRYYDLEMGVLDGPAALDALRANAESLVPASTTQRVDIAREAP
jgi:hypothetical protein